MHLWHFPRQYDLSWFDHPHNPCKVRNTAKRFVTCPFLRRGLVRPSTNHRFGGPPLFGCPVSTETCPKILKWEGLGFVTVGSKYWTHFRNTSESVDWIQVAQDRVHSWGYCGNLGCRRGWNILIRWATLSLSKRITFLSLASIKVEYPLSNPEHGVQWHFLRHLPTLCYVSDPTAPHR
jgi:hypothetical protein